MSGRHQFAPGGTVSGTGDPVRVYYQHDLADPADHKDHLTTRDGWDTVCHRYIVEHLIKLDGYCPICGVHVIDIEAGLRNLNQLNTRRSWWRRLTDLIRGHHG